MVDTPASLAAALLESAAKAVVETRAVVQKGALNVKTQAKVNVSASAPIHNAGAAQFINYDTKIGKTSIDAEIGYDRTFRPAKLGNILEYGTGDQAGHRDLGRALDVEEPRFVTAMALLAEKLLD